MVHDRVEARVLELQESKGSAAGSKAVSSVMRAARTDVDADALLDAFADQLAAAAADAVAAPAAAAAAAHPVTFSLSVDSYISESSDSDPSDSIRLAATERKLWTNQVATSPLSSLGIVNGVQAGDRAS